MGWRSRENTKYFLALEKKTISALKNDQGNIVTAPNILFIGKTTGKMCITVLTKLDPK